MTSNNERRVPPPRESRHARRWVYLDGWADARDNGPEWLRTCSMCGTPQWRGWQSAGLSSTVSFLCHACWVELLVTMEKRVT